MKITIRAENIEDDIVHVFRIFLEFANSLDEFHVNELVISDNDKLEANIKEFDPSASITKIYGCQVRGKTIMNNSRNIVFLTGEMVRNIGEGFSIESEGKIVLSDDCLHAIKNLFHEFGHAKINHKYGYFRPKTVAMNYKEALNEYWKILRNEFMAEMFCANIYRFVPSITWYGEFTDAIEESNFFEYSRDYKGNQESFDGHLALRLLHQYYFVPLFYKAGFLEGMRQYIDLDNIFICDVILRIMGLQVAQTEKVTEEFNTLVLEKWKEFRIVELIDNAS